MTRKINLERSFQTLYKGVDFTKARAMPWEKQFDKEAVLDQALGAFWSRGFEATSLQQLVDCTGVNRASLYATYGDKRALFCAALERYDERRRRMLARLEENYPPREAIRQLFIQYTGAVQPDGENPGCFLTNTALELAAHDREIRAVIARSQADIEQFFARLAARGVAEGDFRPDLDPAAAGRALLAALLGTVVLVRSRPEPELLASIAASALAALSPA